MCNKLLKYNLYFLEFVVEQTHESSSKEENHHVMSAIEKVVEQVVNELCLRYG